MSSAAAATAPAPVDEEEARWVDEASDLLERVFTLPKELKLDPALRGAADKLAAAHLERMKTQLPAWLREEREAQRGAGEPGRSGEVMLGAMARLLNELAYWHVEPGDAEYEKATLEVLKTSPLVCLTAGDERFTDFSSRILRIAAMPPARQEAALAAEARLLEHWGKPRQAVAAWPNPLPQDAAMRVVAQIKAGGPRPVLALPPALASGVLSAGERYEQLPGFGQCALQRWWLEASLAQGKPADAVLSAFRYGTLITATQRYRYVRAFETTQDEAAAAASGTPAYPKLASRFDVTGTTTIERSFDAAGKPELANIVERKIRVRGIRGVRPIAFEDTFDALALSHALQPVNAGKPGARAPKIYEMVWSLEPHQPAAPQHNTPQEKK